MVQSLLYFGVALIFLCGCGTIDRRPTDPKSELGPSSAKPTITKDKHLNINVLWDLSDRINDDVNPASPSHYERDIEIIKYLTEIFKKDMQKKGAYHAKSKIRIFFTPPPQNDKINEIAKNLSYDLASFSGEQSNTNKKSAYDSITQVFTRNARNIYDLTIQANKPLVWVGSDIWRFFKNNVKDYCIEKSSDYRNILIILTDGYIYHKDSRDKQGNRTAYILPETLTPLRNKKDWKQLLKEKDFGLISTRNDLQDLEILVLEISPSAGNRNDEDILKEYLKKWFAEMGVESQNMACYNTDLPEYTKKKLAEFINR